MLAALWNRLWGVHDGTKAIVAFTPRSVKRLRNHKRLVITGQRIKDDFDLADEIEEAPAELQSP